ncbi:hypothetical protein CCX11_07930, partial [Campylobacter jejuni]|nr:hypothetical protein [Campylobacter jejuni]
MKLSDFDFRIVDKTEKQFLQTNVALAITNRHKNTIAGNLYWTEFHQIYNDVEIELWTGYYDRNHKKIYEGDILKIENKTLAKVEFNLNDGFFYTTIGEKKEFTYKFGFHTKGDLEIISNIHENHELLK